jgi:hypothetical protein
VIARGLCAKHYKRYQRHKSTDQTRPSDWGQREKHPYYKSWCGLVRHHRNDMDSNWLNDFWLFVKEMPEKPEKAKIHRISIKKPWSKDNVYWKESEYSSEKSKEYQRRFRKANPLYGKDSYLKKTYGVDLNWYNAQSEKQNHVCAICNEPETAIIHGKKISLAVDHCHDTGKVRGLLCRACNNAIGAFKHDKYIIQQAIKYLEDSNYLETQTLCTTDQTDDMKTA